ncbi:threonine aldolase family protein [Amycolatopsis orientalis]|uniref:threonine aldolase family protein n=1 Tax=Amycolatopsis orientalis TaxID=31958 RepID=UPI00039AC4E8|nr:beta-eliminating lyase-related protein [Amycolatopsis orientalis]
MTRLHEASRIDFASDNCAGVHPEVMAALAEANGGHQPSYGADRYTARLREVIRRQFGPMAEVFPVFNGTGANLVALQAMTERWQAVVCAESAHLHTDECMAPEQHGFKLLTLPAIDGRIAPADLAPVAAHRANRHRAQPGVLSLSQTTELGTCYGLPHLRRLAKEAHRLGLAVHLDGARLANAAVALGCSLAELTTAAGVDVVSLGATKNGGMFGDCIVVLDPARVRGLPYLKKATTQLPSKTRFVSAQLAALFDGDLWARNAKAANEMAQRLAAGLARTPGVRVVHPVQANAVFAQLPAELADSLRKRYLFSTWDETSGVVRLMTAFDTAAADVDAFLAAAAEGTVPGSAAPGVRPAHPAPAHADLA